MRYYRTGYFRNRYFALTDIVLLAVSAYISYVLRLEQIDLGQFWPGFYLFTGLTLLLTPLVFWRIGVYSRYWRYASVEEMLLLVGATTIVVVLAGGLSYVALEFLPGYLTVPRSIPFIFLLLALAVTSGPRLAARLLSPAEKPSRYHERLLRVLVMGAGAAGTMMVKELQSNPQLGMHVVGYLDDDPAKQKMRMRGVHVLGTHKDIPKVVHDHRVDRVIIAMPTTSGKTIREIVMLCEQVGVQTKIIPGIYELLGGTVSVGQLRNVEIEDLLRREPIVTDIAAVQALVEGKRVLVTGAGGSIGSELCRQVMRCNPAQLVLLGHGENSIFEIESELRRNLGPGNQGGSPKDVSAGARVRITSVIADIRFPERISAVFEEHRPQIVFHAAAHKHVPLMEENPAEAITNNVIGTRNLLEASLAVGVQRFVMISTDKAVNPTSMMGASKRVAELLVHQAAERSGRSYVAVRFGNVLGSRGSVVLTFKHQIAHGGPVTVTHPDMVRYFMTIPEAVQLVLQAAALGSGGEVFMLDMGEPVKIADLARDIIELSGLQVGRDIDIEYTGVRPGEKLFEEMFSEGERYERTRHEKVYIVGNASSFVPPRLDWTIKGLEKAAQREDRASILQAMRSLLPEFRPATYFPPASAAPSPKESVRGVGIDTELAPAAAERIERSGEWPVASGQWTVPDSTVATDH
jgi:FlaA1/EpsC-like NDP-sugar epimerase